MSDLQSRLQARINGKKVVVFSKTYCPFCKMAKSALAKYNLSAADYEVIEIENDPECAAIQDVMNSLTGARSVPRVFINGKFVGGGDDIKRIDGTGELQKMLQ